MRLWSLHPQHLDAAGLVAAWREALLARAVLAGETRGYREHPQLIRFRGHADPSAAIAAYLAALLDEARSRDYRFDERKVPRHSRVARIKVTRGQLEYEWKHLRTKVQRRNSIWWRRIAGVREPEPHPLFVIVPGDVEAWERR